MNRLYDLTIGTTTYEGIDDIDVKMLLQRELRRQIINEQPVGIIQTPTLSQVIETATERALAGWNGCDATIVIGLFQARITENQTIQD